MTGLGRLNWKVLLIALAVVAVCILAAFFSGRGLARSAAQAEAAVVASSLESANARVAALQARSELLSANIWVYKATTALDNRNFGVANDAMANAVMRLGRIDPGAAKVDPSALAAVQQEAAALKINVATDLQPQRAALLKLAAKVTDLADGLDSPPAPKK